MYVFQHDSAPPNRIDNNVQLLQYTDWDGRIRWSGPYL